MVTYHALLCSSIQRLLRRRVTRAVSPLTVAIIPRPAFSPDGYTSPMQLSRIVPFLLVLLLVVPGIGRVSAASHTSSPNPPGKALVLEPFATALGFGDTAGDDVAQTLTNAGFQVTVLRDGDVTVPIMENLAQYSVI